MTISCCTWALGGSEADVLTKIASTGLRHIDHRPFDFKSAESRRLISDLELTPTCMATGFGMPEGAALDAQRRADPRADRGAGRADLAGIAAGYGVKLCIEHFPGKALPTVIDTLEFIANLGHDNLYLLLDIGHAQISKEDPAEAVELAGDRLGYFHLDDNDGRSDLHWALLDGVLSEAILGNTLAALIKIRYDGPVSLEMNPGLPDPLAAIADGFQFVRSLYQSTTDPSSSR